MSRDQEISTEEHEKATYGKLMKTQSEEEEEVKCNVALSANDSVSLEKERRQLNKTTPNKNTYMMLARVTFHLLKNLQEIHLIMSQQWYKAQQVLMMKTNHRKHGLWRC